MASGEDGITGDERLACIPGVSTEEVARWKKVAESQDSLVRLNRLLRAQMGGTARRVKGA